MIDYDQDRADDDEAGYRLGTHTFRVGDYVSISSKGTKSHTFKVVSVGPVQPVPVVR